MFREKIFLSYWGNVSVLCTTHTLCPALYVCVGEIGFPDSANRRGGNCRDDRNDGCLGHARGSCFSVPGPHSNHFYLFSLSLSTYLSCLCYLHVLCRVRAKRRRKMSFSFFFLGSQFGHPSFRLKHSIFCFLFWVLNLFLKFL